MNEWHGYILLERPPELAAVAWGRERAVLRRALERFPRDPRPARRWHARLARDGRREIVEGAFDRAALKRRGVVHIFGGVGCSWEASHRAALDYLRAHASEWEVFDG